MLGRRRFRLAVVVAGWCGGAAASPDAPTAGSAAVLSAKPYPGTGFNLSAGVQRRPAVEPKARLGPPWPQIATIFPGPLLTSAGVWLLGRNQTAARLLIWQLTGVGMVLGAGAGLFVTGAADETVGPAAWMAATGFGLFSSSYLAGVYAVLAPSDGLGAPRRTPEFRSELGYQLVRDPQFDGDHYLTTSLRAQLGSLALSFRSAHSPSPGPETPGTGQIHGGAEMRVWGEHGALWPSTTRGADRSYAGVFTGLTNERFAGYGFSVSTWELTATARIELRRYLNDVRGAFVQLSGGYGRQWFNYDLPADPESVDLTESTGLVIARTGFGVYLGTASSQSGEVEVFFDQRHDGLIGGLKAPGVGSGAIGHFGLQGEYFFLPQWGLAFRSAVGSSVTLGLSALFTKDRNPAPK